ncbi:GNAT family N-acetyltransferase [Candidatus Dojkabacteria bacterium]|nr:GNAT family N-acetyltransferase [Candidatus Dojkabacteria bacterium]
MILIRPASLKDYKEIAKIHVETWQFAYNRIMPQEFLLNLSKKKRRKKWKEIIYKEEKGTQTFVAEKDKKVVGFCFVGYCRDQDCNSETGEIWSIYVDQNHMNQGIGTKLMKRAVVFLKKEGYQRAILWVLKDNLKTSVWYEKLGWMIEGKQKIFKKANFQLKEVRYYRDL